MILADARPSLITVYVSNNKGLRIAKATSIDWYHGTVPTNRMEIHIGTRVFQEVDGFGGSFLRSGAITLAKLDEKDQESVLRMLFDPITGAGLSVGKVPIGACDYCPLSEEKSKLWWSYRENQNDSFSIEHDLDPKFGTIPYIRRATQYMDKELWLQATMDFAPQWMIHGNRPRNHIQSKYYGELAQYYKSYALEFQKHAGFPIRYLSLFNEPVESYSNITISEISDLLSNFVGPLFHSETVHRLPQLTYGSPPSRLSFLKSTTEIMEEAKVSKFIDVLFYHGYDCNPWTCNYGNNTCPVLDKSAKNIQKIHALHPQLKLWMTEVCYAQEYGNFPPPPACPSLPLYEFEDGIQWGKMIISDFKSGASAWIYWNMILDQNGGPHLESPAHNDPETDIQHPLVIINSKTLSVTYTGAYWFLAHFGRFVPRGMYVLDSMASSPLANIYHIAFTNPHTDEIVVQLINDSPVRHTIHLIDSSYKCTVVLDPISITTLQYQRSIQPQPA
jgi:glucosylceramidase